MIINCVCASKYQDEKYGRGKRVHTVGFKEYRCTVCGRTAPRPDPVTSAKTAKKGAR